MKLEFSRQIFVNTQISNFMKIRPVGAELCHADRRTNMTKQTADFGKFAKAPKNETAKGSGIHCAIKMRCMRILWASCGGEGGVTECVKAGLGAGGVRRCSTANCAADRLNGAQYFLGS